jgi:sulfur carrier protein
MMAPVQPDITLEINGEERRVPPPGNVRSLLDYLGLEQNRIAVEVNRRIVHRDAWERTPIADRDHVEIVQFVGGG